MRSMASIGDWQIHSESHELRRGDESLRLKPKAMEVLLHLVQAEGRTVSTQELLEACWPGRVVVEAVVHNRIAELRSALKDDARSPSYIRTVPGLGYAVVSSEDQRRSRAWALPLAAVVVMAVGGLATWLISSPVRQQELGAGDFASGHITVRAFETPIGGNRHERLVVGLTDAIERVLATNFMTITRQSIEPTSTPAEFLVETTVDFTTEKVSLNVDVVHQGEGRILWSTLFSGNAERFAMLQEILAIRVTDVMRCALRLRSRANNDPSTQLFSAFLRYCEAERGDGRSWEQLPELSRRIVQTAPEYGISHAVHAFSHAFWAFSNAARFPPEEIARLRRLGNESADKAMAMDRNLGEIYWVHSLDPERSLADQERLLRRSLSVDPEFIYSRSALAQVMMAVGRIAESQLYLERIGNDYPLAIGRTQIAFLEAWSGRLPYARQLIRETAELLPGHPQHIVSSYMTEFWFGDPEVASELLPRLNLEQGNETCQHFIIEAQLANDVPERESLMVNCDGPQLGIMLAYFGYVDAAFDNLVPDNLILRLGLPYLPQLHELRADRRFMHFARRAGLVDYWLGSEKWPDFCTEEDLPYDCKEAAFAVGSGAEQPIPHMIRPVLPSDIRADESG